MGTRESSDRLTAGTFFVLLQEALPLRKKARDTLAGKADGLSNPEILAGLIRIVSPSFQPPSAGSTFSQNTSGLRNCKNDGNTTYMPVGGEEFAHEFNDLIDNNLPQALARTRDFVDRFIDVDSKGLRLVQMLGTLINRDATITDTQEVELLPDGSHRTKAQLGDAREICLESLILGVWKYVSDPTVRNTSGQSTFDRWHLATSAPNATRKFDMKAFNFDGSWTPAITRYDEDPTEQAQPRISGDDEIIEAEIVDDDQANDDSDASADRNFEKAHAVTPHVVFNQYGANSQQIGSVGTLNIGRGL
ncbi:hypothetical protein P8A24_03005 [Arcanobacterium wilhelmae]|uniref:hypothetical protein n=1 Tax=Arcanobacterium wilhelmae TaxID=1803177 RepID=UPI0024158084|nr:hypothetical protein [Arcanobacterium wilhelmae]WFN90839.1 hypothetical protein P8A24_03005 [Arcanobacterium wilhelmae]